MNRRALFTLVPVLALCGLVLAGCGFRPLYGKHSATPGLAVEMTRVAVAPIPNRTGQLLRNALEQRLERAGAGRDKIYTLQIALEEKTTAVGLNRDATTTRSDVVLTATFGLYRDGALLWSGESSSAAAYNLLNQQYATVISERDSRDRVVTQVADDITRRLATFLGDTAKTK
ncbi:MAG: hypothetical protein VR70_15790 [Rhodospirillaceae bacterium BRH_c57]|nr:MAG: hypothetical protein VR70_15790 [Rhodospirillaceae bacterium BRH_c57]